MKKNKKGFSLIELLAVVIILAILALITIPIVGNLIKQARINAAVVSAYGYVEATNNEVVSKQTRGENVAETQYEIEDYKVVGNLLNTKYEGRGPDKGWFILEREKVKKGEFCINGYEVKYEDGKATYNPTGDYCAPPPRPTVCRINDNLDYDTTDYFEILKVEDLVCLSDLVNSGKTFENKVINLVNDIDFNIDSSYNDPSGILDGDNHTVAIKTEVTTGSGFTPIGNDSKPFNGTFKSDDFKTISNLYINRSDTSYVALFGRLNSNAVVKEFNLKNPRVIGSSFVGSLVGKNLGSIQSMNIEGINITGYNKTGGVIGQNYSGSIVEVAVSGNVTGTNEHTGGLIGYNGSDDNGAGDVKNILINVDVTGKNYAGAVTGYAKYSYRNKINAVVAGGTITITNNGYGGKVSGQAYEGTVYVANTVTRTGSLICTTCDGSSYNVNYHYMAMYDDVLDTIYGGATGDYYFDFNSEGKYVLKKVDTHSFDINLSGSGTSSDPYILATESDFRDATIIINQSKYFKIANDLDISTFNRFYPLGTTNVYFNGTLDGNGKTITKMYLNGGQYSGFVSYLNGGSISNLSINNSTLNSIYSAEGRTGILVGFASSGTISNMMDFENITVDGKNNTGGIVGYLNSNFTIGEFNINKITVNGWTTVGGVVGKNYGLVTSMNVSDINISGSGKTGGVVGHNYSGSVVEIAVSGSVTGTTEHTGGLIGYNGSDDNGAGDVKNILINVDVTGKNYVGAVTGYAKYSYRNKINAVVAGGSITITNSGYGGKASGQAYEGTVYVANTVTRTGSLICTTCDGQTYNVNYHYMAMYDDVLDTIYGGATGDYYFDFDNQGKYVLKKVDTHSFDINLSGSGTLSDPYILATESDFRDAAIIINQSKYFKIANDLDISTFNHFYSLGTTGKFFNGNLDGNGKIITKMYLNGGQYSGFVSYLNGGSISNLSITNSILNSIYSTEGKTGILVGYAYSGTISNMMDFENITVNGKNYTGGLIGHLGSNINIGEFNIRNVTVSGSTYVGGVTGISYGKIYSMNVFGVNVSGSSKIGGIVGQNYSGSIIELTVRGTVSGTNEHIGGLLGYNGNDGGGAGAINGIYINVNVTGKNYTAGVSGYAKYTMRNKINAIVEGVNINIINNGYGGKASGQGYEGTVYVSSSVNRYGSRICSNCDGTEYSSSYNGDLIYYGTLKYNTNQPMLESRYTGDLNKTNWWFDYDTDGNIVVVRVTTPPPPVDEDPIETNNGTCPEGVTDNTPPTCVFYGMSPITNGIMAQFSCTDDQGVPNVYSMFNSEYDGTYTAAEIIARTGTQKTGTVSGNTRNITSRWTTSYEGNKPERGRCYYYQYTAVDQCGNSNAYVTSFCEYGFSNPES